MKHILILVLLIDFSGLMYGQKFDWAIGSPGHLPNEIWGSSNDNENNVYICGSFIIGQEYGNNAILAKLDSTGNLLWQCQPEVFYGEGIDLAIDSDGNVIMVANYSNLELDTLIFTPSSHYRILIAKFNPNGNLLWAKDFGSSDVTNSSSVSSIAIDKQNNIYISGKFNDRIVFDNFELGRIRSNQRGANDIFIASLNSDGEFLWANAAGGLGDDWTYDIEIRNDNLYLAGGFSTSNPIFDTIIPNVANVNSIDFVADYSLTGKIKWLKSSVPIGHAFGEMVDLACDSKGNIYAYGNIIEKLVFDVDTLNNPFQMYGLNVRGGMLVKYDSTGNTIWTKSINNAFSEFSHWDFGAQGRISGEVICDKYDNVFLASSFVDSSLLDIYKLHSHDRYSSGKSRDAFIIKYNEIGFPQWVRQVGGDNEVFVTTLKINSLGKINLGGYYNSPSLEFDVTNIYNNASRDNVFFISGLSDTSDNVCPRIMAQLITKKDYICRGDSIKIKCFANYGNTFDLMRNEDLLKKYYHNEFFIRDSGNYNVIINNGLICGDTTDLTNIGMHNKPIASINCIPDNIICAGDTVTLEIQKCFDCDYNWYFNENFQQSWDTNSIGIMNPGIYMCMVDDGYCQNSDTTQIISKMPIVGFEDINDTFLCPNEPVSLRTFYDPLYNYIWIHNDTIIENDTNMIIVDKPGKYFVRANNTYCSDSLEVTFSSENFPYVNIVEDTLITAELPIEVLPSGDSLYSYRWYLNNFAPISSDFGISIETYGLYTITASNHCGYAMDNVTVILNPSGISETNYSELKAYPNPTYGKIKIYTGSIEIKSIGIYNTSGIRIKYLKNVLSQNEFDFDLSNEKEGMYYLKLETDKNSIIKKIVIN